MRESFIIGLRNRFYQYLARFIPGSTTVRVWLHRKRRVNIGKNVFIGTDVLIDTSMPESIYIGDNVVIGLRTTLIGHIGNRILKTKLHSKGEYGIEIGKNVFIGPCVTILPNVKIGEGSVVQAGSVISRSIPPGIMMQGNPAVPVAKCGIPLTRSTPMWDFYRKLRPYRTTRK